MNENTCVCCGRIIPEGRHICLLCEGQNDMQTFGGRPKTNGDRIRQMTDEELANIVQFWLECDDCTCNDGDCGADCFYAACKWLKQEVKQ